MQNVKEKMRNVKVGAVVHLGTPVVWKSGDFPYESTTNIPQRGFRHQQMGRYTACRGIILRAFGHLPLKQPEGAKDKTLAGMQWPHRILFELDPRNQGKDGLSDNQKHKITAAT